MADPLKVINDIIAAQDQLGDFIANGPGEGLPGFVRNQYRDRCDEFANAPQWAKNLNPIGQLSFGRFCRPYWDAQGVDGPSQELPFEGGQCDAQIYLIQGEFETGPENDPTTSTRFFKAWGPIGGFVDGVGAGGEGEGVGLISRGNLGRTSPAYQCGVGFDPTLGPLQYRFAVNGGRNARIVSISPCGLDNCGDPPPELTPGPNPPVNPGPGPVGDPFDDPEGGPIPEIPIPPFDDPVGGPTPIEPAPDPTGGGGGGNPSGGDGLPGDGDAVGDPAGGAAGGEDGEDVDFGEPPAGKVWVGALVECTVDPRLGNIPGTGPSNTVYPTAIANASLRYSTGYGTSRIIRSKWTELARPVTALVVEGCFVQAQPGVTASVRPISATICPDNPCEE